MKGKIFGAIMGAALAVCVLFGCVGCGEKVTDGEFYSLKEASQNNWLTQDDLKNIAYYFHVQTNPSVQRDPDFSPKPKSPETLSGAVRESIKKTYLNKVIDIPDGDLNRITIRNYYGTYNGCVAVMVWDDYNEYDLLFQPEYELDGVKFYNYCEKYISIWKEI